METRGRNSHAVKVEYWRKQIKEWKASSLSQKQFCHSRSLALSTFCYWKSRINNADQITPKFYPLTIPASPGNPPYADLVLLVGPKQFQVQIKKDFSPFVLKKLITTLEQL